MIILDAITNQLNQIGMEKVTKIIHFSLPYRKDISFDYRSEVKEKKNL